MYKSPRQRTFRSLAGNRPDDYELGEYDWTFERADTTYLTHGLHRYPARMIPQIPDQLFDHFLQTDVLDAGDTVYDPFGGSGTTAVEARLHGLDAITTDINPFACFLSRTKATPVPVSKLYTAIHDIFDDIHVHFQFIDQQHYRASPSDSNAGTELVGEEGPSTLPGALSPDDRHVERQQAVPGDTPTDSPFAASNEPDPIADPTSVKKDWFPVPQVYKLECLERRLAEARANWDYPVVRFIRIALAETARTVSYQQPGEFKRQRISEDEREDHNPDVWETFCEALEENLDRMEAFVDQAPADCSTTVKLADARDPDVIDSNSVDAIVTSPPYGDHSTTVAYGQFSFAPMVAATALDEDTMRSVDPSGLGGRDADSYRDLEDVRGWSDALEATLDELEAVDGRSDDALAFFADYAETIVQMGRVLKEGQPAALVVGNRTMSRVPIPTHLITQEFMEAVGFESQAMEARSIPSKTLPFENAPENIEGETGEMMADEYLVVGTAPDHPTVSSALTESESTDDSRPTLQAFM